VVTSLRNLSSMADNGTQGAPVLDFPISLDELFAITPNYDNLKEILKWLLEQIKGQSIQIGDLRTDAGKKDARISDLEKRLTEFEAAKAADSSQVEKLTERVEKLESRSKDLEDKNQALEKQNERLDERVTTLENQLKDFDDLKREVDALREKAQQTEKQVSDNRDQLLNHESTMDENKSRGERAHSRIDDLEDRIQSMNKRRENADGAPSTLTFDDLDNLKYELLKDLAKKSDLQDLEERVRALERDVKEAQSDIIKSNDKIDNVDQKTEKQLNELRDELEALRKLIKELEDKLDGKVENDLFAQEIHNLKLLISSSSGSGKGDGSQNINFGLAPADQKMLSDLSKKLADLEKRIAELEKSKRTGAPSNTPAPSGASEEVHKMLANTSARLKKIESMLPENFSRAWDRLFEKMMQFQEDIATNKEDIEDIKKSMDKFADKDVVRSLRSQFEMFDKRLLDLSTAGATQPGASDVHAETVDMGAMSDLRDKIDSMKTEFDKFRDEIYKLIDEIEKELQNKVDLDTLWTVENKLLEKLDQLSAALGKKFADKAETNKGFKNLEKQLNELLLLYVPHADGDDALLSKKYLGGWSCASCEKGLEKLASQRADYNTWNRFPLRDPNDRLARVGPGFSRMLGMIRPESVNHLERRFNATAQEYESDSLPKMKMNESPSKGAGRPKTSHHGFGRK